jgi:hypothetical protein
MVSETLGFYPRLTLPVAGDECVHYSCSSCVLLLLRYVKPFRVVFCTGECLVARDVLLCVSCLPSYLLFSLVLYMLRVFMAGGSACSPVSSVRVKFL